MINKKEQEQLLQMALFGELEKQENAQQRVRFQQLLQESPEAASLYARLQNTAKLAENIPQAAPSADLEHRILSSLPQAGAKTKGLLGHAAAIASRCPYYFFLVGAFYLIFGVALQTVLFTPESAMAVPDWVRMQPNIAFATGFFFILSGAFLLRQTPFVAKLIYGAVLLYIVFVAANGLALEASLRAVTGGTLLPALIGFVGMGLTIGMLLGVLLQHYAKEVQHG